MRQNKEFRINARDIHMHQLIVDSSIYDFILKELRVDMKSCYQDVFLIIPLLRDTEYHLYQEK